MVIDIAQFFHTVTEDARIERDMELDEQDLSEYNDEMDRCAWTEDYDILNVATPLWNGLTV
jgi:hypothetical protein